MHEILLLFTLFGVVLLSKNKLSFSVVIFAIVYGHLVVGVVNQMTTILNIRCFIVKPKGYFHIKKKALKFV